jgi:hypothetical protein
MKISPRKFNYFFNVHEIPSKITNILVYNIVILKIELNHFLSFFLLLIVITYRNFHCLSDDLTECYKQDF